MTASSPQAVTRKWRPPLGLVLGGALAFTLAAPPLGLLALRWLVLSPQDPGFRTAALLVTAAVVVGTAVLGWLLWRLILRPVTALADRATALGDGDPAALLEPMRHYGTREISELGARVLAMAGQLQGREATIRSFADHVTHEFLTPIAAISGAAEMLSDMDGLDGQDRRLVDTVAGAARRLDDLLSALRRVTLLRATSFAGQCRISELIEAIQPDDVGLAVRGADVVLPLSPDGLRLVLDQLVQNSVRHGATEVRLKALDQGPALLIEDDGEGIAPGDAARIFDPFFTTRRGTGGTGMGLAIVRTLLEAQGARIDLLPSRAGTTFRIDFDRTRVRTG